jgi:hypothetical protein
MFKKRAGQEVAGIRNSIAAHFAKKCKSAMTALTKNKRGINYGGL